MIMRSSLYPLLDSERFKWQSCIAGIIDKFLDLGANLNARIIAVLNGYCDDDCCEILAEASPLALIDFTSSDKACIAEETQARLRSAGAVNYRKCLYLRYNRADYYRLSKARSERLDEVITSSRTDRFANRLNKYSLDLDENAKKIIRDIEDSFSNEDAIDEQTVRNEIESLPKSF